MPVLLGGSPAEPATPAGICSAQRDNLVIGPGPDAGGSNQGKTGGCHVPVKSGMDVGSVAPREGLPEKDGWATAGTTDIATSAWNRNCRGSAMGPLVSSAPLCVL